MLTKGEFPFQVYFLQGFRFQGIKDVFHPSSGEERAGKHKKLRYRVKMSASSANPQPKCLTTVWARRTLPWSPLIVWADWLTNSPTYMWSPGFSTCYYLRKYSTLKAAKPQSRKRQKESELELHREHPLPGPLGECDVGKGGDGCRVRAEPSCGELVWQRKQVQRLAKTRPHSPET